VISKAFKAAFHSSGVDAPIGIFRCPQTADGSVNLSAVPDRLDRLLKLTGLARRRADDLFAMLRDDTFCAPRPAPPARPNP